MNTFSRSELGMWKDHSEEQPAKLAEREISEKYSRRELRIVTETNREQLPNFVAAMKRPGWIKLQPFYQRRRRWDDKRKSKLIESFIMNIPVPPCFLYESEFARYEVMDGQQRISSVFDFYENQFALKGLEQWPELNGRSYSTLPLEIRKGLDRRSISYIVLLKESAANSDEEMLLRQQVFERLNTGGIELEGQEVRHCLYHNGFEEALIELARTPAMRRAWSLPEYSEEEDVKPIDVLLENAHYSKMRDVEFVLRFFALRHVAHYSGGMKRFLDQYMLRSRSFGEDDIRHLKILFQHTLDLAEAIYGDRLFRPWNSKKEDWATSPQVAYADSVMVGLTHVLGKVDSLVRKKDRISEASKQLVVDSPAGTFTGQGNTKKAVELRINSFIDLFKRFAS